MMESKKTILATAYAVNPYKGSEDGMGWNFIRQIARFNNVIAITRLNNRKHIENYMHDNPSELYENITFLYYDLPYWMRFWKKGGRGAMLYYLMWQKGIVNFIKRQKIHFDIVHNLNFHNDWTPSYLWKLNKPFVWGPVGHHSLIPWQFISRYPIKYFILDRLTWFIKQGFWLHSQALKKAADNADVILCMNSSVLSNLYPAPEKISYLPSVATEFPKVTKGYKPKSFRLISAGRLVPLKGFDLAIKSFSTFLKMVPPSKRGNCILTIVGSGPEAKRLKNLSISEGVGQHIEFIQWLDRQDLMNLYHKSSAFLFPSHEGAGMVVAEALSYSLPVICLKNDGPGEFIDESCGIAATVTSYNNTINTLAEAIYKTYSDDSFRNMLSTNAFEVFKKRFHWDRRGEFLNNVYSKLYSNEDLRLSLVE